MKNKIFGFFTVVILMMMLMSMSVSAFGISIEGIEDDFLTTVLIIVFSSILVSVAVCYTFYKQMKTANKQKSATEYLIDGGVQIFERNDSFSHSTQTSRRRSNSNS